MKTDKATSIFWLLFSILVAAASFRLGLGNLNTPGSGFMTFGAAILLGLLSITAFLQASVREKSEETWPLFRGLHWPRVVLVFIVLIAYSKLMPLGGYNMTTFCLLASLFWIAGQNKVWKVILYALITTVLSFYVFSRLLNLQFPIGPLGF